MAKKNKTPETPKKSVVKGKDVLYNFHINEDGSLTVTVTKGGERIRTVSKPNIMHVAMWFANMLNFTLERMAADGRPVLNVTCSVP